MLTSNRNIVYSDFESALERNLEIFKTTASLLLQWLLLSFIMERIGAWSVRHGGKACSNTRIQNVFLS